MTVGLILMAGCGMGFPFLNVLGVTGDALPSGLTGQVASKAISVADQIGDQGGFGGLFMNGYESHMMPHMGFHGLADLADPDGGVSIKLSNDSDEDCTFIVTYFASHLSLEEQTSEVAVPAGQEITTVLPCSEIVGLGPLEQPGGLGCRLADGEEISNTMAVPGFLGTDYDCNMIFHFSLVHDVDDLDGDGDTEELVLLSDALLNHMTSFGPFGHMHGF